MTMTAMKVLPPGFQRICGRLMHVARIPGLSLTGPTVALIHGIGAAGASWLPLMRHLAKYVREMIVFDMPAHGLSPAPSTPFTCLDCYECVRQCLLQNLCPESNNLIIGNSLGGAFTLKFTLDHPDYVAQSVLISPAGMPFPESAAAVIKPFCGQSLSDANKVIDRIWVRPDLKARLLAPALYKTMKEPAFQSMMNSILEIDNNPSCELAQMILTPEKLKNYNTKTLLIWGGRDRVLPIAMREAFDREMPACVTRLFPSGYGHCPQFEEPLRLSVQIIDWIQS